MERKRVSSSSIRSVGYEADSEILEIEFNNGGVYHYAAVPEVVYDRLMAAPSKGRFFDAQIKEKYRTTKVN